MNWKILRFGKQKKFSWKTRALSEQNDIFTHLYGIRIGKFFLGFAIE